MSSENRNLNSIEPMENGVFVVKNGKIRSITPIDYGEIIIKYQDRTPVSIKKSEMLKF